MEDKMQNFEKLCVPIYDAQALDRDESSTAFIGTGTLIGYKNRLIVLTAGHCLDNRTEFAIGRFNPPLRVKCHPNVGAIKSNLDLGFIDLGSFRENPNYSRLLCLMWSSVSLQTPVLRSSHCQVLGYPAAKNSANSEKSTLNASLTLVDVAEDIDILEHTQFSEIKLRKDYFIGLRYDPRLLEPSKKKRPKIKAFNGFSGGAIWRRVAEDTFNFIGILIESHSPRPTRQGKYILYGINVKGIDCFLRERFG